MEGREQPGLDIELKNQWQGKTYQQPRQKKKDQRENIAYLERTLARAGFGFVSYGQETHNQRWLGREGAHESKKRKCHRVFTKALPTVE